jgi:hypothetical protein
MQAVKALWLGLLAATVLLVAAPAGACGCGVALDAAVTRERALIVDRQGREEIIASFDLQSEGAGRAAIVIPVPADPEVEEIAQGDPLTYLDIATAPEPESGGGADTAAAGAVDVIGRDVIGGYDVARLRADDSDALDGWLDENGYTLPDGAEPILAGYVEDGWRYYVAIRLAPYAQGALKPLRIAFDTDELVYPMRLNQLATAPLDLTLYVLSGDERLIDGLDVAWSGSVDELEPDPPAELEPIFAAGTHLTKLTATGADPASFAEDYVFGNSAGGEDPPWWGPLLAIGFALTGVGLLFVSRRG